MPRPLKNRIVNHPPLFNSFKPTGMVRRMLQSQILTLDEFEAVRLADYRGLEHKEAAEQMEISRSTFTRLIDRAHTKVATFLVEGRELKIDGGAIHFRGNRYRCEDCYHTFEVEMGVVPNSCPACGSTRIRDLASDFGHGECCSRRNRNHRGRSGRELPKDQ